MTSPIATYLDDKDLDDAALWAAIDSAAAASSLSSATAKRKPIPLKNSPIPKSTPSPHVPFPKHPKISHLYPSRKIPHSPRSAADLPHSPRAAGEVIQSPSAAGDDLRNSPAEGEVFEMSSLPLVKARHVQRTFTSPVYASSDSRSLMANGYKRSNTPKGSEFSSPECMEAEGNNTMTHCLSGCFPTVSLFKDYQNAAMAILEKTDYTMISGHPYIKKTGWRKISFYFNVSYEIRDKTIECDEHRNVIRAEFVVRALMQGGRFSDGWGSCDRREKKFLKPNHDIPSTAETRAKNKACQDLLGIGEYRPGASHVQ